MQAIINGEPQQLNAGTTIAQLLGSMDIGTRRYAVERNEEIVPRSQHAEVEIEDGDEIEVVVAIGGG